jgi:exopolyphosphatase / guanosine-5'-triphosphate,3'-diphosphate pyrophosphatase
MTERVAIIDLGSNSARLIIMHIYRNGAYNLVYHQKETIRLSEGMNQDGTLHPMAMDRAVAILEIFAHMCKLFDVNRTIAVATAAVRSARNGKNFVKQVQTETGILLQIISGEEEAKIGFTGVINTIDVTDGLLFDLGGGSTEITLIRNRKAERVISLPFGAVNLTERFNTRDKVGESELAELTTFIEKQLVRIPWLTNINLPLIGVGGTARNIAKMDQKRKNYPFSKIHNYRLGHISVESVWRDLLKMNLAQRRKMPGLSSERADIIVAGATIVKGLFHVTGGSQLIISGCGVREGLFFRYYLSRANEYEIIPDILMHSTHNMLQFYKGHISHAYKVADFAESMFDGWQSLLGCDTRDKTLMRVAALLHDIGITINYYDHPRHSVYLVENARLFGLTHREQMIAAVIAGWHNGPVAKYFRRNYSQFLDEADWQTAKKLALLVALGESLDTTQMGLIKSVYASCGDGQALLRLVTDNEASVERQAVDKHRKWFKKELGIDLVIG